LSIPLIKKYGVFGPAIGTAFAMVIGNIFIMNWYYHKKIGLNIFAFWFELLKMTPGLLIPAVMAWFVLRYYEISGVINLLLYIGLYTILYAFSAYCFSLNKYEKSLLLSWKKKK
jgi:O-antigen/teichoic acid export membrane protein